MAMPQITPCVCRHKMNLVTGSEAFPKDSERILASKQSEIREMAAVERLMFSSGTRILLCHALKRHSCLPREMFCALI